MEQMTEKNKFHELKQNARKLFVLYKQVNNFTLFHQSNKKKKIIWYEKILLEYTCIPH